MISQWSTGPASIKHFQFIIVRILQLHSSQLASARMNLTLKSKEPKSSRPSSIHLYLVKPLEKQEKKHKSTHHMRAEVQNIEQKKSTRNPFELQNIFYMEGWKQEPSAASRFELKEISVRIMAGSPKRQTHIIWFSFFPQPSQNSFFHTKII